jgi:tRNA (adenine57-N1/adenine58-N1)-methyltransferase
MDQHGFGMASTLEVLHRTWHLEHRSVRPDHRMVGHTGFLTTARLLLPVEAPADPVEAPADPESLTDQA